MVTKVQVCFDVQKNQYIIRWDAYLEPKMVNWKTYHSSGGQKCETQLIEPGALVVQGDIPEGFYNQDLLECIRYSVPPRVYTELLSMGDWHNVINSAPTISHYFKNIPDSSRRPEVDELPGIKESVKHPVTEDERLLEDVIISLNDKWQWTREQIADWLDTLDIDLTFK